MPGSSSMSRIRFTILPGFAPPDPPARRSRGAPLARVLTRSLVAAWVASRPSAASPFRIGSDDGEGAALARRALQRDPPGVRLDDPLDEAEAEAGALDLRRDDVGRAVERIEDLRLVGGGDADAAIADADLDVRRRVKAARDADPSARRRRTSWRCRPGSGTRAGAPPRRPRRRAGCRRSSSSIATPAGLRDRLGRRRPRRAACRRCATGRAVIVRCPDCRPANSRICSTRSVRRTPFAPDELAVLADPRLVVDDAVGEVVGGRSDHGERRAQLVRHGRDELELLAREILRAPRRQRRGSRR